MTDPAAHRAEVEAWREQRYAALRRDVGWLTLAGLDWLRDGVNRIGSDPAADVRLPGGPPDVGTITIGPDGIRADGSFLHGGAHADGLVLASDRDGPATMLELDSLRLCVIERAGRLAVRTWNLDAAARRDFGGIEHWPVDVRWRLDARFEPTNVPIAVPQVLGGADDAVSPGDVVFEIDGRELRLQALPGAYGGDELWLVFGDETNRAETYGGGRFLYTAGPNADGTLVVDFNRAYNPPCVFSPYATCPLPWPANRLPIRIEAGEQRYEAVSLP